VIPGRYRLSIVDRQERHRQLAQTVLLGGEIEPVVDVSPGRRLVVLVDVDDAFAEFSRVTIEVTDDPLRVVQFIGGRMVAGVGEVTGARPAPGHEFDMPIPEGSRHVVAIWTRTATGRVVPIPESGPLRLTLSEPDTLMRLYGNLRATAQDLQREITLRFYDERAGIVAQSRDSFMRGQNLYHLEGRQYTVALPPGTYRVRAGVRSETAGFVRQYDLGFVRVDRGRRWDIDLRDAITAVTDEPGATPRHTRLQPAYPNPFNQSVVLPFETEADGQVLLTVYNLVGQPVRELVRERRAAGTHNVVWDGVDDAGQAAATGMYIVALRTGGLSRSRKVLLLR
jgi:hypothetical protein